MPAEKKGCPPDFPPGDVDDLIFGDEGAPPSER